VPRGKILDGTKMPGELLSLRDELLRLRRHALNVEHIGEDEIALVDPARRAAARNLVDYLALRQHELGTLQRRLGRQGFSSLGAVQGHVMASIEAVLAVLDGLSDSAHEAVDLTRYPSIEGARGELRAFADETLGVSHVDDSVRIMVTMPSEAATNPAVIDGLLESGMTVMRVNCAHDGPVEWAAMIENLRRAEQRHHRACRVSFDLAGPKLRTGPLPPGPEVMRFKPVRDSMGCVISPGTIALWPGERVDSVGELTLVPMSPHLFAQVRQDDVLQLRDTRGRQRSLKVDDVGQRGVLCSIEQTVYLATGTELELHRDDRLVATGTVGRLPAVASTIPLAVGDTLVVTRDLAPGRSAVLDSNDDVIEPARIGCSPAAIFAAVRPGHRVQLDDGKLEGVIRETAADSFVVDVQRAGRGRAQLKAEKGINLPDTPLDLPALTDKDLHDLEFVASRADLVALSFVHSVADVERLYGELDRLKAPRLGVILKIENRAAFASLPELLMTASKRRRIAVMVARGDLAVEIGFERLAEVQEEILWLTEAAQVPVIWATQVLESLAKNGLPSRGDVTDAAMSARSECVMLNKGPYVGDALRFLTDVSRRMSQHADKTFATHRRLSVAASEWLAIDRSDRTDS